MRSITVAFLLLAFTAPAFAGQDPRAIEKAINDFLGAQVQGLPGKASYSIGTVANAERLKPCDNLQVALPPNGKLWGKTNVVVRCNETKGWTLYVPVKVNVIGDYLVSSHPLRQGQPINPGDFTTQNGDLGELPTGTLTDPQQTVGATMATSIGAGQPLRSDMLRQALLVQQGQTVRVVSRGAGFEVANEGEALNNATRGQLVRVRLGNGQLVKGIADSPGTVAVAY